MGVVVSGLVGYYEHRIDDEEKNKAKWTADIKESDVQMLGVVTHLENAFKEHQENCSDANQELEGNLSKVIVSMLRVGVDRFGTEFLQEFYQEQTKPLFPSKYPIGNKYWHRLPVDGIGN